MKACAWPAIVGRATGRFIGAFELPPAIEASRPFDLVPATNQLGPSHMPHVAIASVWPVVIGRCNWAQNRRRAPYVKRPNSCELLEHCSPPILPGGRRGERNAVALLATSNPHATAAVAVEIAMLRQCRSGSLDLGGAASGGTTHGSFFRLRCGPTAAGTTFAHIGLVPGGVKHDRLSWGEDREDDGGSVCIGNREVCEVRERVIFCRLRAVDGRIVRRKNPGVCGRDLVGPPSCLAASKASGASGRCRSSAPTCCPASFRPISLVFLLAKLTVADAGPRR